MQSGREDTLEEGYAIKFCFKLGKRMECFRLLFEWHKEGREFLRDDERCGRSKEVNIPELIG